MQCHPGPFALLLRPPLLAHLHKPPHSITKLVTSMLQTPFLPFPGTMLRNWQNETLLPLVLLRETVSALGGRTVWEEGQRVLRLYINLGEASSLVDYASAARPSSTKLSSFGSKNLLISTHFGTLSPDSVSIAMDGERSLELHTDSTVGPSLTPRAAASAFDLTLSLPPSPSVAQGGVGNAGSVGSGEVSSTKSKRVKRSKKTKTLSGIHVLIVDDVPMNLKVAGRLLDGLGARYSTAGDGIEAMELLTHKTEAEATRFHLVILDVDMPRLDGPGVLTEMRRLNIDVPVFMLSGNVDSEVSSRCLQLGAKDFLHKPLRVKLLLPLIRQHIPRLEPR